MNGIGHNKTILYNDRSLIKKIYKTIRFTIKNWTIKSK